MLPTLGKLAAQGFEILRKRGSRAEKAISFVSDIKDVKARDKSSEKAMGMEETENTVLELRSHRVCLFAPLILSRIRTIATRKIIVNSDPPTTPAMIPLENVTCPCELFALFPPSAVL